MAILSVRLPKDVEKSLPRKARSAWVIDALRQKARRDRLRAIAGSAGDNAERDLAILAEWEHVSPSLPEGKPRRRN